MIYRVNSASFMPGKREEAQQAAVELATYVNASYPDVNVEILAGIDGVVNRLHWSAGYKSLVALEDQQQQYRKDAKLQELQAKAAEVIDLHHSETHLYRTVE